MRTTGTDTAFSGKLGKRILPPGTRVYDDPTLLELGGRRLWGSYAFDDEGVAGSKVVLVEEGILKTFLMSRTPRKGLERSNGHGRADGGDAPRARIEPGARVE